jgi:hypothetical protein
MCDGGLCSPRLMAKDRCLPVGQFQAFLPTALASSWTAAGTLGRAHPTRLLSLGGLGLLEGSMTAIGQCRVPHVDM